MAASDGIFRHASLDDAQSQIRLLKVEQRDDNIVKCQLEHFSLATAPEYIALSYVWGSENDVRQVTINGGLFLVRSNLHHFLKTVISNPPKCMQDAKRQDVQWWLWIDQICIDQTCVAERNDQVQMMHEIYLKAAKVIAWLGHDESGGRALWVIKTLPSMGNRQESRQPVTGARSYRVTHSRTDEHSRRRTPATARRGIVPTRLKMSEGDKAIIKTLFDNPYWKRVWIVQEVIIKHKVYFLCDSWELTHRQLERFTRTARSLIPFHVKQLLSGPDEELGHLSMNDALEFAVYRECSDPRDMVFALQSLVMPRERLQADYSKTIEDVYADAAASITHGSTVRTANPIVLMWQLAIKMGFFRNCSQATYESVINGVMQQQAVKNGVWRLASQSNDTRRGIIKRAFKLMVEHGERCPPGTYCAFDWETLRPTRITPPLEDRRSTSGLRPVRR